MSNHSWNEHAPPVLQPDGDHPGRTVARNDARDWPGAVEPRRENPTTGFELSQPSSDEPSERR